MTTKKVRKKVVKPRRPRKPVSRSADAIEVMDTVNKAMGKEVLRRASDPDLIVRYLSTGILPFDILLGGGLPRGRIVELYGDWSTLKSYICYRAIAQTQLEGGMAALVDTEHTFDPEWAELCGIDVEALLLQYPETGEEAVDVTHGLVSSGSIDLIAWDSVAGTTPRTEAEHMESGDKSVQPGRLAALMSRGLRKIVTANKDTALVFTNQTRMNIGITYGSPETTPGGKALPFYASLRLNLRKAGKVEEDIKINGRKRKMRTGTKIRIYVEKSKVSAPYKDTTMVFDYRIPGIDEAEWLLNHGVEYGYIKLSGKSYTIEGHKVTYSKRAADYIRNEPAVMASLRAKAIDIGHA